MRLKNSNSDMNQSSNKRQIDSLQMVRGIAALLVVLHHIGTIYSKSLGHDIVMTIPFIPGYMGVDIFFVLSGFLMYYIHHKDIGTSKNRLLPYLKKRLIRIYPAYWVVLIALVGIYFAVPSMGYDYYRDASYILNSFLLIPQSEQPLLGVAWTLTHEVYFYLIFGLLIILNKKYTKFFMGAWLTFTVLNLFLLSENYLLDFFFSPYNFEFLYGIIVARFILKNNSYSYKKILTISILMLLIVWSISMISSVYDYRVLLWGIPSALLLYGLVAYELSNRQERKMALKIKKALMFLGDASYSIYLTHIVGILFFVQVHKILNMDSELIVQLSSPFVFIFLLVAGCLFHLLVEKPLLKIMRRPFGRASSKHKETEQLPVKTN
ncbi:acyltransferase [Neobacillus mesonae]|nr:acyltransferase [Neobacillus mesonae]